MDNDDIIKKMHDLDQNCAMAADVFPPLWRRLYVNCMNEGFNEHESLQLVKTYIHATSGGSFKAS